MVRPPSCGAVYQVGTCAGNAEVHSERMTTAELSELGPLAEKVKNGETIELTEGGRVVAKVVPALRTGRTDETLEDWLDVLVARGLARRGSGSLPADFFARPLPQADASVVDLLLEDRHAAD